MDELFISLIALVVFVIVLVSITDNKQQRESQQDCIMEEHIEIMEDLENKYIPTKRDILMLYWSDISDKRERLVLALDRMSRYKDTTDFFEEYPDVHRYIFTIQ